MSSKKKTISPGLSTMQKTHALAWAAKRENMTYGVFTAGLSRDAEMQIYREFEEHLREMEETEKRRAAAVKAHPVDRSAITFWRRAKDKAETPDDSDVELDTEELEVEKLSELDELMPEGEE